YLRKNIIHVYAFVAQHLNADEVLPIFVQYINDEFKEIRLLCIHGISKLKSQAASKPLQNLIKYEEDAEVKNFAIRILNELRN
ncbi:MAG: HEAT repeat domain-containing protein, partial [Ruminiclostridium sp.]